MDDWVEEPNELLSRSGRKKRRPKRKEFVGWGSKQLIRFLQSRGKSTEEKISQHDVTSIINDYIDEMNLKDPAKRRNFLCDENLYSIFGKKSVVQIKIFGLLESHYAENEPSSDGEGYSSDEREEEKHVNQKAEEKADKRKKASEALKSCFAAIVPENIKAVFLRKTLVQELLKDADSFESKVLGSFVRAKADRYDYKQKNSHLLQLVTGIKKDAADGDNVRLEIADLGKHISLSELSDVNFSEEECKDLHRRIKEDLLKQPTVAELQEKVQVLHEDITKDWLPREIKRLGCLIDVANEKGWRRECFEHREKWKLLQTPDEQSRLLQKVPEVIAEELQLEPVPENTEDCSKKENSDLLAALDWVILNDPPTNGGGGTTTSGGANPKAQEHEPSKAELETNIQLQNEMNTEGDSSATLLNGTVIKRIVLDNAYDKPSDPTKQERKSPATQAELIVLSDDEEERSILEERVWNYIDPQGEMQGPFTLKSLKMWCDLGYFDAGFTVWKSGESQEQQVLLIELLQSI